eukprot:GEMP01036585.1.p1 GENE.GEMP01036585.1~~GEMP01036585.1.p1  ORF type:complete len:416 (+),score=84.26 GEMP01036585.1:170-1417(+)
MRTKTNGDCTVEGINDRVERAMERRKQFYKDRVQNKFSTWNDPSFRLPYEDDLGESAKWPKGSSPSELIPQHAERARYLEAAMMTDESMIERKITILEDNMSILLEMRGGRSRQLPSIDDVDVPLTPPQGRPVYYKESKRRNPVWFERSQQLSDGLSLRLSKSEAQIRRTAAEGELRRRDMATAMQKKQEHASAARTHMVDESVKAAQASMSGKLAKFTVRVAKMKESREHMARRRREYALSGDLRKQTQRAAKIAMTTLRQSVNQHLSKYGREKALSSITDEQRRRMNHNAETMERVETMRQFRARQEDSLNHTASDEKIERANQRRKMIQLPPLQHAIRASHSSPLLLLELKHKEEVVSRRALARSMKLEFPPTPPSPVQCVELSLDDEYPHQEVDVLLSLRNYVFKQIAANV